MLFVLFLIEYIDAYCEAGTQKVSNQIPIASILDMRLKTIMFTITWVSGTVAPHLASHALMHYGTWCLLPMVFDWCTGLISYIKA